MPKSYTDKERTVIISQLRTAALESMVQKGVKKTTVDELVQKVHIPKGTFYLFYQSKELLLFDAIVEKEEEIHKDLIIKLQDMKGHLSINSLVELLTEFFHRGYDMGILPLMMSGELEVLIRKLPDEVVAAHIAKDDEFLGIFKHLFPSMKEEVLKDYSAAFRGLFFTAAYKREIGDHFDGALKLLMKGLVKQMWEVEND